MTLMDTSYAAIDLGSNSFHMVVAEPEGDSIRIIDSLRVPVRLGSGLDKQKRITPDTEKLALDAIAQFAQRLRGVPRNNVRIVGTNTLRRARNAEQFLSGCFTLLDKRVETISGREEARLIYSAVAHGLPSPENKRLVIDIGGGSTELITGQGYKPELMESLNIGCVSFTNQFLPDNKLTQKSFKKSIVHAQLELQPIVKAYRESQWDEVIGCSGTIKATSNVLHELELTDGLITQDALKELTKLLVKAGTMDKLDLKSISKDRSQVFAGGVAILYAVMKTLKIEQMQASQVALREGLIFELIGKAEHIDIQTQTVANLVNRYHIDEMQSIRVRQLALSLFELAAPVWKLDPDHDRNLLAWASTLHEIGLSVAHSQYHKHGAYLIENSDLLGFSRAEQSTLALLVRYHRRKLNIESFAALPDVECEKLLRLLTVLRLAVLLQRARYTSDLELLNFKVSPEMLSIEAPAEWFESNPLTTADLQDESRHILATGISLEINSIDE